MDLPRVRGLLLRLVREEEWKRRGSKWQITRLKLISSFLLALNSFNVLLLRIQHQLLPQHMQLLQQLLLPLFRLLLQ